MLSVHEIRHPGEPPFHFGPFPPPIASDQASPPVRVQDVQPFPANPHHFSCKVEIAGYTPRISFSVVRGRIQPDLPGHWNQVDRWTAIIAAAIAEQWADAPSGTPTAQAPTLAERAPTLAERAATLAERAVTSAGRVSRSDMTEMKDLLTNAWERLRLPAAGSVGALAAIAELDAFAAAVATYVGALREVERKADPVRPLGAPEVDIGSRLLAAMGAQLTSRRADLAAALPAMEAAEATARTEYGVAAEQLFARFREHNDRIQEVRAALATVAEFLRERDALDVEIGRISKGCRQSFIDPSEIGLDRCGPAYLTAPANFTVAARLPGIVAAGDGVMPAWVHRHPYDR